MNANYLAFMYFNKYVDGFYQTKENYDDWNADNYFNRIRNHMGWDFRRHPLTQFGVYVDYYDSEYMREIQKSTSLKINFWNYLLPFFPNFY